MKRPAHYRLVYEPEWENPHGVIMTAALMLCDLCGKTIDSMGGPGSGQICEPCGDLVKRGLARGAIVWEENKE